MTVMLVWLLATPKMICAENLRCVSFEKECREGMAPLIRYKSDGLASAYRYNLLLVV